MAAKSANAGGQNPEFILREFEGMNNIAAREGIGDNEFYWCENAIPVAPGSLYPVPTVSSQTSVNEATSPTYTTTFTQSGVNYQFVVFAASGNGYIVLLSGAFSWQKIITGLTSGQTYATPYNNQGLLIVDPAGYWDWNVTTAGTLTPQNNSLTNATLVTANTFAGGSTVYATLTGAGTPTGGSVQAVYEVSTVTLVTAGTGYAVGDTITLTDGSPTTDASIVVASISGSAATGPITGITLSTGGDYPGPIATGATAVSSATGPTGTVIATTGVGTGATFSTRIKAISATVVTRGSNYIGTTYTLTDTGAAGTPLYDTFSVASSDVIGGTSIATYAGRVWIGLGRTVYFTDIDTYDSFGGVGGSFSISDAYLHANITVLYSANNYLYIFGDTSIDALSNVTVSSGVTSFSRINVTASVGCSAPASVFPYYRAIIFYNVAGIYLLAGATPEKISEKISGIIQNTFGGSQIYGASVLIRGELCAVLQFLFTDTFTSTGTIRPLFVMFFRGRWWVFSFPYTTGAGLLTTAMASISVGGVYTLYALRTNGTNTTLYTMFGSATLSSWLLKTKLWDGGSPTHEKQSINAAIGGVWAGAGTTGVTVNVDTELSSNAAKAISIPPAGYQFEVTLANNAAPQGAQYLGLTVAGSTDMTQINMLALRGKADRNILA
jgi:hypothetical protein